jgi:hypothetical protein
MPRKQTKSMKRRTHKGRRHRGGGWGFTGPSSIPGTPGIVNNPQVFTGIGDCRAVQPGYNIPYSQYSASLKGLPGMSGGSKATTDQRGGKRTRKHRGKHKQRGGRYGFFPESIGTVTPNGAAWWAGTYPPVQRIACEGTTQNPLNPTHTGSSEPPGAANPNYYLKGGKQRQRGGAQQLAPATYGVGNVDSMYYYAPTAGYANTASTWKDSVGAPVQIQVPYAAREMNQACLSTGGHPPLTGALQKGGSQVTTDQRGGKRRKTRRGGAFYGIPTSMNNLRSLGSQLTGLFGVGATAASTPEAEPEVSVTENETVEGNINITPPPSGNAPTALPAPTAMPAPMPSMNNSSNASQNNIMPPNSLLPTPGVNFQNTASPAPVSPNVIEQNENPIVMGGRRKKHRKHKKGTKKVHKGRKH